MAQGHMLSGRYRLDAVVGRGGMGTVWRAYDARLDREVAVKEVLLPPGLSPSERDILYERTFREARASARLNHPGVVTVHDVVEESGRPWIVMEYVQARSLQDLIDEGGVVPRQAAEIGRQTLGALQHAHRKGILHRDVKPSNVLITRDGRAVLTDWGIAQTEGDSALTQTGLVMGSPAYIPPERAQGERAVPASDLWALGATLYAAVEGQSPYDRPDAMSSLAAALSEPVPPPRNAGPLRPVLDGLLAREPRFRMTADRALALLTEIAGRPEERPGRDLARTVLDETSLDQPLRYPPEPGETVLDSPEVEPPTRDESGYPPVPPGHSVTFDRNAVIPRPANPQPANPQPANPPSRPAQPRRDEPRGSAAAPAERPAGSRPGDRPVRVERLERPVRLDLEGVSLGDAGPVPPPASPMAAEAPTVLQSDWPSGQGLGQAQGQGQGHGQGHSQRQVARAGPGPQTPPPFDAWRQVSHLMPERPGPRSMDRTRRLTIAMLVAVVLALALLTALVVKYA